MKTGNLAGILQFKKVFSDSGILINWESKVFCGNEKIPEKFTIGRNRVKGKWIYHAWHNKKNIGYFPDNDLGARVACFEKLQNIMGGKGND